VQRRGAERSAARDATTVLNLRRFGRRQGRRQVPQGWSLSRSALGKIRMNKTKKGGMMNGIEREGIYELRIKGERSKIEHQNEN